MEKGSVCVFQVSMQNCYSDVNKNCHFDVGLSSGALSEEYIRAWNTKHIWASEFPGDAFFTFGEVAVDARKVSNCGFCQSCRTSIFCSEAFKLWYQSYLKLRSLYYITCCITVAIAPKCEH